MCKEYEREWLESDWIVAAAEVTNSKLATCKYECIWKMWYFEKYNCNIQVHLDSFKYYS